MKKLKKEFKKTRKAFKKEFGKDMVTGMTDKEEEEGLEFETLEEVLKRDAKLLRDFKSKK